MPPARVSNKQDIAENKKDPPKGGFSTIGEVRLLEDLIDVLNGIRRKMLYDTIAAQFCRTVRLAYLRNNGGKIVECRLETVSRTGFGTSTCSFPINGNQENPETYRMGPDRFDEVAHFDWGAIPKGQDLLQLIDACRHYADIYAEQRGNDDSAIVLAFDPTIRSDLDEKEKQLFEVARSLIGMQNLL